LREYLTLHGSDRKTRQHTDGYPCVKPKFCLSELVAVLNNYERLSGIPMIAGKSGYDESIGFSKFHCKPVLSSHNSTLFSTDGRPIRDAY